MFALAYLVISSKVESGCISEIKNISKREVKLFGIMEVQLFLTHDKALTIHRIDRIL